MMDVIVVKESAPVRFVVLRYRNQDLRKVSGFSLHDSYSDAVEARDRWVSNGGHEPGISYSVVTMTGFTVGCDPLKVVASNLLRMTVPVQVQR